MSNNDYQLPDVGLLSVPPHREGETVAEISRKRDIITRTLREFGIAGEVTDHAVGPRVTRFEITLAPCVRVKKIAQITDNLAMELCAAGLRVLVPMRGRKTVGVEVPRPAAEAVFTRDLMESEAWKGGGEQIPILLGETWNGAPVIVDLAAAPHILMGGVTGSGKSVCLESLVASLLFRFSPEELKLVMIDPKRIEYYDFRWLPHLLAPVICDRRKAAGALNWTVGEIERRFESMHKAGVKNIRQYNDLCGGEEKKMPRLVVIIDELADLMFFKETREDVEHAICRIAQLGRSAGVHLIVSTVRPSPGVITDVIRANFPTRIAFRVLRKEDSQAILDQPGAEELLGTGDMLVNWPPMSGFVRTQGAYIPYGDLKNIVAFVGGQVKQEFVPELLKAMEEYAPKDGKTLPLSAELLVAASRFIRDGDDDATRQAVALILLDRRASVSCLQRRLRIGYDRALEILETLRERELLSPPFGHDGEWEINVPPRDR